MSPNRQSALTNRNTSRLIWLDIVRIACTLEIVGFHWLRACIKVGLLGSAANSSFVMNYRGAAGKSFIHGFFVDQLNTGLIAGLNDSLCLFFGFGWQFVNVLILVSGLSLSLTTRSSDDGVRWPKWIWTRTKRILIPYYCVAIPILTLFSLVILTNNVGHPWLPANVVSKFVSQVSAPLPEVWRSNLLLFDPVAKHGVTRFVAPAWWFIPAILVAYIFFPVWKLVHRKIGNTLFLTTGFLISAAAYRCSQSGILLENAWYFVILNENFSFSLGIVLGTYLACGHGTVELESTIKRKTTLFAGGILFVAGNVLSSTTYLYCVSSPMYTSGLTLIVMWFAYSFSHSRRLSSLAKFDAYWLYLLHQPFAYPLALVVTVLKPFALPVGLLAYIAGTVLMSKKASGFVRTLAYGSLTRGFSSDSKRLAKV